MTKKQHPADTIVTNIITQIEEGLAKPEDWTAPWHRGTAGGPAINATTGRAYTGINTLLLGMASLGRETNKWASFKQWKAKGAQVRKGEKGTMICFYSTMEKETGNVINGEPEVTNIPFLKVYSVFNADQVEGFEDPDAIKPEDMPNEAQPLDAAEAFVLASGAIIHHQGGSAFYDRRADEITMPERARFMTMGDASATENYYSTLLHELTHWTGAKHRLDRVKGDRFGDPKYAFEELVAELGAAFLCRHLRISSAPRLDHAQYLASWLKCLKEQPRALFRAAAHAQRAVDFLDTLASDQGERVPAVASTPKPAPATPEPVPAECRHYFRFTLYDGSEVRDFVDIRRGRGVLDDLDALIAKHKAVDYAPADRKRPGIPPSLTATEPTQAGLQLVIPGAEKRPSPKAKQLELF